MTLCANSIVAKGAYEAALKLKPTANFVLATARGS